MPCGAAPSDPRHRLTRAPFPTWAAPRGAAWRCVAHTPPQPRHPLTSAGDYCGTCTWPGVLVRRACPTAVIPRGLRARIPRAPRPRPRPSARAGAGGVRVPFPLFIFRCVHPSAARRAAVETPGLAAAAGLARSRKGFPRAGGSAMRAALCLAAGPDWIAHPTVRFRSTSGPFLVQLSYVASSPDLVSGRLESRPKAIFRGTGPRQNHSFRAGPAAPPSNVNTWPF